jgi:glycosyltransferase involved in cell wall biosynthesis
VSEATIVLPCFNEEKRLDDVLVADMLADPGVRLLFVDDGSSDGTLAMLHALASKHPGRVRVLALAHNRGKAEAVREGLRAAVADGADVVAYLDADFATPPSEMKRILAALFADRSLRAALGARVALLGTHIERKAARHYLGRVFATAASMVLGVRVYDTQCGAKAFRVDDVFRAAVERPFTSKWVFDVELLDRLLAHDRSGARIAEVPLHEWRDVRGSKLGTGAMLHAGVDLARIAARRAR